MKKDLKAKAIDIKGKDYVMVKDRIAYFNETYPNGSIRIKRVRDNDSEVIFKAVVVPDVENPARIFVGHATGDRTATRGVDSTNPVENAETSAVGRALAMMGIGVLDSIASADEVKEAVRRGGFKALATDKQKNYLNSLITQLGVLPDVYFKKKGLDPEKLTAEQASKLIEYLKEKSEPSEGITPEEVESTFADVARE